MNLSTFIKRFIPPLASPPKPCPPADDPMKAWADEELRQLNRRLDAQAQVIRRENGAK